MNQTTVARVLGWLADATGKDAACDREKLVELMNDIRQLAYANKQVLEHAKPAYICVPVQCFCPASDPGAFRWWVIAKTATSLTIGFNAANAVTLNIYAKG